MQNSHSYALTNAEFPNLHLQEGERGSETGFPVKQDKISVKELEKQWVAEGAEAVIALHFSSNYKLGNVHAFTQKSVLKVKSVLKRSHAVYLQSGEVFSPGISSRKGNQGQ